MDTLNNDRLTMVEVNNDFCLTPETISATAGITNFPNIVATVTTSILVVKSYNELGNTPIGGVTKNVQISRRLMVQTAYKLANGTYSYASSPAVEDLDLQEQSYVTINSLERLSKEKCLEKCEAIYTLANANAAGILLFGVSAADLTNANSLNNIYFAKINKTQAAINIRKNAKKQAIVTLDNIIKVQLGKQLDTAANTLRFPNSEWWDQYQESRQIINLGTSTTRIKFRLLTGINPVNDAKSTIVNKMVVKKPRTKPYPTERSTPEGMIIHDKLGTGLFDITIEKEGYITKILRDNRVKLGNSLNLGDILFQPQPILGTLENQETKNIFSPESSLWIPGITVRIRNTTPQNTMQTKLIFYGALSPTAPAPPDANLVLFNQQEIIRTIAPADYATFVNVFNAGPNPGSFEITFL